MSRQILIATLFTFYANVLMAQRMPVDEYSTAPLVSQIGAAFNRVFNDHHLDSVYSKLGQIKKTGRGTFRIVHIGDSHLQAGHFPGHIRSRLQDFFGDAGRGIVFAYDAIRTTSPDDLQSSSNSGWNIDKVATTGDAEDAGVSGFGISSGATGASLTMTLKGGEFSRLRLFLGNKNGDGWIFQTNDGSSSRMIRAVPPAQYADVTLEEATAGFTISTMPSEKPHHFYGVSLETGKAGVIYHAIGVNGARYDQYNRSKLFWKQLPGLQADLYIISLGTNDAQRSKFEQKEFLETLKEFLDHLRKASPGTPVILSTAPDSYRNGRSNQVLRDMNLALFEYCTRESIPVWDLYRVTNGYGSAYGWLRKGLMNVDRVHFTAQGYQLQAQLFFNAFARGYNSYHGH